jgi:hypothetical protein
MDNERVIKPADIYEIIFYTYFILTIHKQNIKIIDIDLTENEINLFNDIFTDKIIEKKIDNENNVFYYIKS